MSIWLNPERVTFAGNELTEVRRVQVQAIPFDPNGLGSLEGLMGLPAAPMDVQIETRVECEIVGLIAPFDLPGATGTLSFEVAVGRSDGHRQRIELDATLAWATLVFDRGKPARRVVRFLTISSGGDLSSLISVTAVNPLGV